MEGNDWLDTLVRLGPLTAAVVALLVVLVIQPLKNWMRKPRISIRFEQADPYCHVSIIAQHADPFTGAVQRQQVPLGAYWVRVWVVNEKRFRVLGGTVARRCKGKLVCVRDSRRKTLVEYDPLVLHWVSHGRRGSEPFGSIDLSPGEMDYLDVFHTVQGQTDIQIDTVPEPRGSPLHLTRGEHYLTITIYGENFDPKSVYLHVVWDGKTWDELQVRKVRSV